MANLAGFDASTIEPNTPFEPLPAGDYKAIITNSEMKPTKAGDGKYLELELTVIEGACEGRKLFDKLNLDNPSDKAVQIAKGTLSAICRAVGKLTPKDSAELHNIPLVAKVVVEIRKDNGEAANRVKGYKPASGGSQPPPLSQASGKAPWAK